LNLGKADPVFIAAQLREKLQPVFAQYRFQADEGRLLGAVEQAMEAFQKAGYEVFGKLDDYPPGHSKYFLKKELVPGLG
jgi:hypothetical protein